MYSDIFIEPILNIFKKILPDPGNFFVSNIILLNMVWVFIELPVITGVNMESLLRTTINSFFKIVIFYSDIILIHCFINSINYFKDILYIPKFIDDLLNNKKLTKFLTSYIDPPIKYIEKFINLNIFKLVTNKINLYLLMFGVLLESILVYNALGERYYETFYYLGIPFWVWWDYSTPAPLSIRNIFILYRPYMNYIPILILLLGSLK